MDTGGAIAIAFDEIAWLTVAPGLRTKTVVHGGRKLRLVELGRDFVEPDWCTRGHAGLVLEGAIDIDVAGTVLRFRAGDGLFIPAGEEHHHRHHATLATARLFLVEEEVAPKEA
jgi:Cupin domain